LTANRRSDTQLLWEPGKSLLILILDLNQLPAGDYYLLAGLYNPTMASPGFRRRQPRPITPSTCPLHVGQQKQKVIVDSCLHQVSRITHHASRITFHVSRLTASSFPVQASPPHLYQSIILPEADDETDHYHICAQTAIPPTEANATRLLKGADGHSITG
jgi:hypothetical protein